LKMITVGSLFAGIGGLDLGLERAGMQVRWQVENNSYCIRVLEKHWPKVKRYGDIKQIKWAEVEPVDLICGGFPCQPVSVAGSQKGDKDDRWLWPEFLRAIREIRPKYAIVENVPGLLSTDSGRLMGQVLGDLALCGYDAEWDCISAASVGAWHRRDRIFIVAYRKNTGVVGRFRFTADDTSSSCEGEVDTRRSGIHDELPTIPDTNTEGLEGLRPECKLSQVGKEESVGRGGQWVVEPDVGRVAHGVPSRVDRLKCLGNAVVPQVAELIGRLIVQQEMAVGD